MTVALPPRISLAQTPTPLEFAERLTEAWQGPRIWIKRDDLTGFGLSGNKVRKLEFHFAAARDAKADTVITCGAVQSNHSRSTALAAARLGFRSILVLRKGGEDPPVLEGNYLLDLLSGADVRLISPAEWPERDGIMAEIAQSERADGHECWIIPEGASDALGMWAFVLAVREIADQSSRIDGTPPVLWHAASSGGTTAGLGWGVDRLSLSLPIVACSVGDSIDALETKVGAIWSNAAAATQSPLPATPIEYVDRHIDGGYGVASDAALAIQAEATALTGLIFDPTYTGKALVGLRSEIHAGRYSSADNIIFWHTGGGFAVFAHDFSRIASAAIPDVRNV